MAGKHPYRRSRERDNSNELVCTDWSKDTNCSAGYTSAPIATGLRVGTYAQMSDTVTPGFYELSKQGKILNSPMTSQFRETTVSGSSATTRSTVPTCGSPVKYGYWGYNGPVGIARLYGSYSTSPWWIDPGKLITQDEIDNLVNLVSTNAWAKVRGNTADLSVDLSQIGLTLSMLSSPLSVARKSIGKIIDRAEFVRRSAARGKAVASGKGHVGDLFDAMGGVWLEGRFGVRPLIGSMESIVELLSTPLEKLRRTARTGEVLTRSQTLDRALTFGGATESYRISNSDEVHVRAGILWDEEISLKRALGLDAQSLLSAGWDLLPWSFVSDWFLNIGKALQALVPYMSQQVLAEWTTIRRVRYSSASPTGTTPLALRQIISPSTASGVTTWTEYTRVPHVKYGGISTRPGSLRKVSADLRIVDSFFLTAQLARGKFR